MKPIHRFLLCLLLPACATARGAGPEIDSRAQLWRDAHDALATEQYGRADTLFSRIAREEAGGERGRESLFFLGALRLDPRNPGWSSESAETALRGYLAPDSARAAALPRQIEAETLYEIARQLNMPAEDRVPALQGETRVVTRVQRVVVPAQQASSLAAEVARLREQLAARDATIRRQEEELDRIRKTLAR